MAEQRDGGWRGNRRWKGKEVVEGLGATAVLWFHSERVGLPGGDQQRRDRI